jgi:hypothetical protein
LSLHNSFLLILLNFKSAWCNCSHYLPFHPWKILFDPPLVVKFLSLAVDSNWSNWCNNACIKSRTLCSCNKPQWWGSEFEFLSCIKTLSFCMEESTWFSRKLQQQIQHWPLQTLLHTMLHTCCESILLQTSCRHKVWMTHFSFTRIKL